MTTKSNFITKLLASLIITAVLLGVASVFLVGSTFVAITSLIPGMNGASTCSPTTAPSLNVDLSNLPTVDGFNPTQVYNAAVLMEVGSDLQMGERAQLIEIMTAMQEADLGADPSSLTPNPDGDAGLFQQRTLPGWYGTLAQVNDPAYAAKAFLQGVDITQTVPGGAGNAGYHLPGLKDVKNWQTMPLTQAAQAVQRSGFPDEYAKHEADARRLMAALAGVSVPDSATSVQSPTLGCEDGRAPPVDVATGALPTQAQLSAPSSQYACPAGTTDLGQADGGYMGGHVAIRLCSITGTICTGSDCAKGTLNGLGRGEVVLNSLVAPFFMAWLNDVRAAGYDPTFSSSFRSWASQTSIWNGGANGNAARPGLSNHQMGAAVDIAGIPGTYTRNNCAGHAPDGGCMSNSPQWAVYHSAGIARGAAFHPEEFWHLEWIITHPEKRNIPFIPKG